LPRTSKHPKPTPFLHLIVLILLALLVLLDLLDDRYLGVA
jgi:hypothetical protein